MFLVSYLVLAGTFIIIGLAAKFDETIEEPIDDESRHAFDDWFKDANIESTAHRISRMSVADANKMHEVEKPAEKKLDSSEDPEDGEIVPEVQEA